MRRRKFLAGGAAALGGLMLPRVARAGTFGDAPNAAAVAALLAPGVRAEKCLEVYLYGGMASFESFYVVEEYGRSDDPDPALRDTMWHLFESDHGNVFGGDCGLTDPTTWLTDFGLDANGKMVQLGPLVGPLRDRPDVVSRMRVLVMQHEFEPHEAAVPQAMCGLRLGNPRMAGLGTHVQRYWQDRDLTGRVAPWSYVFSPVQARSNFNTHTAAAVGTHPGSARPLLIKTSDNMDLAALLGRREVGMDVSRLDPLLRRYAAQNVGRHTDLAGNALRSRAVSDHNFAIGALVNAPALQELLPESMFEVSNGKMCSTTNSDISGMALRAGVSLLTNPVSPAKYVNVVDGGFQFFGDLPYDTHFGHLQTSAINHRHIWQALVEQINEPGEGDPAKIDLDDTMICITAEFGRTPYLSFGGTNHFPHGYVSVLIGGPVVPGVSGALGPDGYAVDSVSPAEFRAGMLAGLGIYPFHADGFAVGDLLAGGAGTEIDQLVWLNERILGRV